MNENTHALIAAAGAVLFAVSLRSIGADWGTIFLVVIAIGLTSDRKPNAN